MLHLHAAGLKIPVVVAQFAGWLPVLLELDLDYLGFQLDSEPGNLDLERVHLVVSLRHARGWVHDCRGSPKMEISACTPEAVAAAGKNLFHPTRVGAAEKKAEQLEIVVAVSSSSVHP
jgi:hypothetical protein